MTQGEPIECKSCGGIYEGPVTMILDGEERTIQGHVQGDAVCKANQPKKRDKKKRPEVTVPSKTVWEMTPSEKAAREEAIRETLKASGWRKR